MTRAQQLPVTQLSSYPVTKLSRAVWAALLGFSACVLALQFITLPKVQNLVVSASAGSRLESVRARVMTLVLRHATEVLGPIDWVLIALLGIFVAGFAIAEIRH